MLRQEIWSFQQYWNRFQRKYKQISERKKTVRRNQREAVRKIIHSFRFVRPAGGHNVSGTTGTQYRAATQLFWAIVMSDECDVLCCHEVLLTIY